MMKTALKAGLLTFLIIHLVVISANAADVKYKVADIPKELISNASAVVRNSETVFEISDKNTVVQRVTYAITILNEKGIEKSVLTEFYDKFLSVRKIKADLYDQYGVPVKNKANVRVEDYSANDGSSLYADIRVKFIDPKYRTLPFTVEYTYEISYDALFYYPDWMVYNDYNISVEKASLTVLTPKGFKFRYLEKNAIDSCRITEAEGKTKYSWAYKNMPAIKKEPFSTSWEDYTPVVYSAPGDFEVEGYKGNIESWKSFGSWINLLGKGRNVLDAETNAKIKSMVSGIDSDNEKIRVLYNYFQNKVRYVNVSIGIGGWQTIEAEKVDHVSYGDCKALTNYMKSLLDVAGIKSYYTLVRAGESAPAIRADFPSNQFNHAILCVPVKNDTIWLECTSQLIPFGYLGSFTDDRKALLTDETGGTLVSTRKYSISDNLQLRKAVVELSPDGNATSNVVTSYKGILYDKEFMILHKDETDRRKFVQSGISIPSYNLVSLSFREDKSLIPSVREDLNLKLINYGVITGNKIIIKPNLMTRVNKPPYMTRERKSEICIRRPYNEIDTVIFKMPAGFKMDLLPEKISITTKFGDYSSEVISGNKGVSYIRTFKLFKGNYPAAEYPDFVNFFEKISRSDEGKMAFIRIR